MTLLVLSDSHGRVERIREAISGHRGVDTVLFLGDGLRDLDALSLEERASVCAVRGNCDGFSFLGDDVPVERLLRFGDYTVLMMHGHTHGVKASLEHAAAYAASRGADLLLYGHTHMREERYLPAGTAVGEQVLEKPLYLLNPGSLGAPREGKPSYGLVDLTAKGIVLSHGCL